MNIYTGRHAQLVHNFAIEKVDKDKTTLVFPEIAYNTGTDWSPLDVPRHSRDIVNYLQSYLYNLGAVITLNPVVIRFFCQKVRKGEMKASDLRIFYIDRNEYIDGDETTVIGQDVVEIVVDDKGNFCTPCPDDMFDVEYELLFH